MLEAIVLCRHITSALCSTTNWTHELLEGVHLEEEHAVQRIVVHFRRTDCVTERRFLSMCSWDLISSLPGGYECIFVRFFIARGKQCRFQVSRATRASPVGNILGCLSEEVSSLSVRPGSATNGIRRLKGQVGNS